MKEQKNQDLSILEPLVPESTKELISQLEETIGIVFDAEKQELKPDISFVNVMKDLAVIRKSIEAMVEDQQEMSQLLDSLKEKYGPIPETEKLLGKEDTVLYEKLKMLEEQCESARTRLHNQILQNPKAAKEAKEMLEDAESSVKRKSTKRKRKFRSMGGEQGGWIKT